jgi:glycosyltransferase involved in cell wall biosynthesis
LSAHRPPSETELRRYFERFAPAVVLFLETPFNDALYRIAPEYGIRTVGVPMHETFAAERLAADLLICPCPSAWSKAAGEKVLMFLPIGLDMFPYRERRGHVFVMNIGYGWHADRRQCAVVVEAFRRLRDPGARLILYAQQRWPEGAVVSDPRISYRLRNAEHPADNYAEGDILIAPMAYEGYGRTVLEGMASGMPVLTTDADPMNLFQHDPDLLIKPHEVIEHWSGRWVRDVSYNRISSDDMHRKLEWLLTIDTPEYSRRARRQAEAQSWQSRDIDYRRAWRETLEELCSSG